MKYLDMNLTKYVHDLRLKIIEDFLMFPCPDFNTFKDHRAGILLNVGQLGFVRCSFMIRCSLCIFRI